MIRVLNVAITDNLGGIERYLLNVYENIDRKTVHFDFITECDTTPITDQIQNLGGEVFRVASAKHVTQYIRDIYQVIQNGHYDIVYLHKNSAANILPLFIAKFCGTPRVIIHSHNTSPKTGGIFPKILHYINRSAFRFFHVTKLACSKEAAYWMFGSQNSDVTIIRNGIELNHFQLNTNERKTLRRQYGISENTVVIGEIASFTREKNHTFLLDIYHRLVNENKKIPFTLLLVGQGPLQDALEKKASMLGLSDQIIFAGSQKDVAPYLWAMDMFVMPSLHEGLPISAIEAQASGLPVCISANVDHDVDISGKVNYISNTDIGSWVTSLSQVESRKEFNHTSDCIYDIRNTARMVEDVLTEKD